MGYDLCLLGALKRTLESHSEHSSHTAIPLTAETRASTELEGYPYTIT